MALLLCVLLTAVPGSEQQLIEYEDQVLALLPAHGARVVQRVRATEDPSEPFEVHLLEFPSEDALDAYMHDPARVALQDLRDRAIAHTHVIPVESAAVPWSGGGSQSIAQSTTRPADGFS